MGDIFILYVSIKQMTHCIICLFTSNFHWTLVSEGKAIAYINVYLEDLRCLGKEIKCA